MVAIIKRAQRRAMALLEVSDETNPLDGPALENLLDANAKIAAEEIAKHYQAKRDRKEPYKDSFSVVG